MKIYFGKADPHDVDEFGDEGVFAIEKDGETLWFYQGVEHGTNPGGIDEVRIFDGCNRSIPISIEQIPELVEALNYCYNNHNMVISRSRLEERIESDEEAYVINEDSYTVVYDAENQEETDYN
jgi:hypothetical protein